MRTLLLSSLIFCLCVSANAQEIITEYDARTLPVLNEELRKTYEQINSVQDSLNSLENDDTKIPKTDIDTTTTLGTSDTKVPSQNAVKTYVDTEISGVSSSLSNVIFCWNGMDDSVNNASGLITAASLVPTDAIGISNHFFVVVENTARVILRSKYKHISGIANVSIYARIWARDTQAATEAVLTVNIGGQSNTVKSVTSATPSWVTPSTVDVSGLTDGTVYDITISLNNESGATGTRAYCSAVMLIGNES